MTDTAATPESSPTPSHPAPGTKVCAKCGEGKSLLAFPGRRNTCSPCIDAAKARRQERKEAVTYSDALGERITDMLASGMTVAEITEQPAMPTPRQLRAWRRGSPEFHSACEEAEQASAAAHIDKAKEVLRQAEDGNMPVSDAKQLADAHLKLAATLHPRRYGTAAATIDLTNSDGTLKAVTAAAAIEALIAALPDLVGTNALDAPKPLLPSPIPSAGDSAVGEAAGDCVPPAASSESDADPYAEPGEDLGPMPARAEAA